MSTLTLVKGSLVVLHYSSCSRTRVSQKVSAEF